MSESISSFGPQGYNNKSPQIMCKNLISKYEEEFARLKMCA